MNNKAIEMIMMLIVGLILTSLTLLIGKEMDDDVENTDQGKHNNDCDLRIYVPNRCRYRRGNNRQDQQLETKGKEKTR